MTEPAPTGQLSTKKTVRLRTKLYHGLGSKRPSSRRITTHTFCYKRRGTSSPTCPNRLDTHSFSPHKERKEEKNSSDPRSTCTSTLRRTATFSAWNGCSKRLRRAEVFSRAGGLNRSQVWVRPHFHIKTMGDYSPPLYAGQGAPPIPLS